MVNIDIKRMGDVWFY